MTTWNIMDSATAVDAVTLLFSLSVPGGHAAIAGSSREQIILRDAGASWPASN